MKSFTLRFCCTHTSIVEVDGAARRWKSPMLLGRPQFSSSAMPFESSSQVFVSEREIDQIVAVLLVEVPGRDYPDRTGPSSSWCFATRCGPAHRLSPCRAR
jgi:hypothetical protein